MVSGDAIRSGLSWQSASLGVQVTMQLLVIALLARLLEPQAFGLVAAAYITIDLCQLLSEAGASAAVVYRQRIDREFVGTAWLTSIAIGVFLFAVLVLAAAPIAGVLAMPELPPVLMALGGVFVLMGISRVPEALLQRELRFAALMKINLASQVIGYVLPAVVLALMGCGVWALVAGTLLQCLIKAVYVGTGAYRSWGLKYSRSASRELLGFGMGITKERLWNYVVVQGDRFVIGRRLGAETLGQYHVMAIALLPSRYFGDVIDNVFFPVMARMRHDRERLTTTWLNLITNCFVFMFGAGMFMAANGEAIVSLVFGERWLTQNAVFQVLATGAGFRIISRVSDSLNRALGLVHETAHCKMINALLFLPCVWIAASYGLVSVCIVLIALQAFNACLQLHLAWRGLGLTSGRVSASLRRAVIAVVVVLLVNGIVIVGTEDLGMSALHALLLSLLAHVAIGPILFWPLVRHWRYVEGGPRSDSLN